MSNQADDFELSPQVTPQALKFIKRQAALARRDHFTKLESEVTRDPVYPHRIIARQGETVCNDSPLNVTFKTVSVLHHGLSVEKGEDVWVDEDWITIIIPGEKRVNYHGRVLPYHEWRFKAEYEAFKAGRRQDAGGTPLAELGGLGEKDIQQLNGLGVHYVEQLATLSDSVSKTIRGFHALRQRGQQFLAAKEKSAAAQVQQKLDKQAELIEKQSKLIEQLLAQVQEKQPRKASTKESAE